ncbi:MAG: DNA-directed RNA polymerase subunit omega [Mariprofundaceae bacterium]
MARITIEDCIRHYPNRFELVLLASRRARQIMQGHQPQIDVGDTYKPAVMALREIGKGAISWEALYAFEEQERQAQLEAAAAAEAEAGEWSDSGAQ